jgi:hypothetical protein
MYFLVTTGTVMSNKTEASFPLLLVYILNARFNKLGKSAH